VAIGAYRGVVLVDAKEGDKVTVWLSGSYKIDVAGALTVGQVVYLNSSGALTAPAGDTVWGVANVAKTSGTGPAEVVPFGLLAPTAGDSGKGPSLGVPLSRVPAPTQQTLRSNQHGIH